MLNGEIKRSCIEYNANTHDIDKEVMRQSLSSITYEIQRLQFCNQGFSKNNFYEIIKTCKSCLKSKNEMVKILRDNIKTACFVAKIVISSKENESRSMKNFMNNVQIECSKIKEAATKFEIIVSDLVKENRKVENMAENLYNLINACYQSIQNICNEPIENLSLFDKFKKVTIFCSQCDTGYHNQKQKNRLLEQKTSFYQKKIKILETNLKHITSELKDVRYENVRLQRLIDNELKKEKSSPFIAAEHKPKTRNLLKLQNQKNKLSASNHRDFDTSTHLSLIKKLLSDQDTMIKNLNQLSKEVSFVECNKNMRR